MARKPFSAKHLSKSVLKKELKIIEAIYGDEDLNSFVSFVDYDYPNYADFIANLNDYFSTHKDIELKLILDSYLTYKDRVDVKLHWLKKVRDKRGNFSKLKGNAELIFKVSPSGFRLIQIKGDNPFLE